MLILSLTFQSLFKEFATKTQLGHVHCCSFATQFHEMQLNTHTLQSLPRKGLSCLQELPCPSSFPGSCLVPSLKINWWRGCLQSQGKSWVWDGKSHYKVLPADKIRFRLSHLKQKAAQRPHIYVLWQILLKANMDVHVLWLQDTHRYIVLWLWVVSESVSECSSRCREFLYPCKGFHL